MIRQAAVTSDIHTPCVCSTSWHGRTFAGLPKARQRQFENYSVMCIIVKSDTDRDVVFAIYQDINTGKPCTIGFYLHRGTLSMPYSPVDHILILQCARCAWFNGCLACVLELPALEQRRCAQYVHPQGFTAVSLSFPALLIAALQGLSGTQISRAAKQHSMDRKLPELGAAG
jgi:hypothetical protein